MKQGSDFIFRFSFLLLLVVFIAPTSVLVAQEESSEEIFWGDDEDEEMDFGEDFDFSDEEEGDEGFEFGDDEFGDEEFGDEEFGDEDFGDEDFSDDFAEEPQESVSAAARRLGYTLNIIGSSPGFVNHQLRTYNSGMDFRAAF